MSEPACCCKQLFWHITAGCKSRCEMLARINIYIKVIPTRFIRFRRLDIADLCAASSLTRLEKKRLYKVLIDCMSNAVINNIDC